MSNLHLVLGLQRTMPLPHIDAILRAPTIDSRIIIVLSKMHRKNTVV